MVNADEVPTPAPNVPTGRQIAVVGSGPYGLTAAYFLGLMGHKVVIFEEHEKPGGMLRYGIPEYRLPKERLDRDIRAILSAGNWMPFHFPDSPVNRITNAVFDEFARIPEYKVCAVKLEKMAGK